MAQIDYDMFMFREAAEIVGKTEEQGAAESFFETDEAENTPYCFEYGFHTVNELEALTERFLKTPGCPASDRENLIRACIAGTFKYAFRDRVNEVEKGRISEYIYEF